MDRIEEILEKNGVVPVIKLGNPERDAKPLAEALLAGGTTVAEVTFRAEGAADAIRIMKESCPDMTVGAGTVLMAEQIDEAVEAGAQFIVTPGLDTELVEYCRKKGIPILPGCTTASDYHKAFRLGLKVLKFFPAEQSGGAASIKALSAPFPMFRIMPTGGISLNNLRAYLSLPVVIACGGSYMVNADMINEQRWEEITELCRKTADIVKEIRGKN